MTLQLAVQITGNSASLKQAAEEGKRAVDGLNAAIEAAGAKSGAGAAGVERVTTAVEELASAEREAAGAAQGMGAAIDAAGDKAQAAAAGIEAVSAATRDLAAAERDVAEAAAAAQRAMEAARRAQEAAAGRPVPAGPAIPGGAAPGPAPATAPVPGAPSRPPANMPGPAEGAAAGLRPDQWKNLGFQTNDILTSLFSGIPVTQVIAQQGGQVTQVLADAPGGIAGGLKIVASRALEVLTPVRLMAGGFTAAAAAVAYLGVTWARSQEDIRNGLMGIGAQSRATVADINRIAETSTAGGRLSRGDARGIATAVASTGKVDVSNISDIVNLAPGYAKLFGKDLTEAGSDLARIFADPVKGAEELNARIGGLDAATRAYIRTMVEQGASQDAVRATVRAFVSDIDKAAEKTGLWAKAWKLVSTAADAAGAAVAKPFTESTAAERAQKERERLRQMEGGQTLPAPEAGFGLRSITQDNLRLRRAQAAPVNSAALAAQREASRKADEAAEKEASDAAAAARTKSAAQLSQQAEVAVRGLQPEIDQLEALNTKIILLQKTQSDLDALSGLSAAARKQYTDALASARAAVETFMSAEDKARASEALTIQSIEARTVAQKASIAAERERIALAGRADVTPEQRARSIANASAAVFAQSTRETQDRLRDSTDANASAGLLSYQRQRAELETRYRKLYLENQGNLPAIANLQKSQAQDRQALDKEAIGGPLRDANRALTEQAAALKLQQDSFGATTEAAARMAEAQRLVNQYNAAGVPITADLKRGIDAQAASVGKITAAQEELARKQREVVGGLDDLRSGTRSGLSGIFSDLTQGRSPLDGITSSLGGIASRIFDRNVSAPLVNGLFGLEGKAGGGIFGDAISGMFGKAQGLSTADISAGVVNLSGPVAGIPGLGGAAGAAGAGTADAAKGILSGLSGSKADVAEYVRQSAMARGIDPDVALRVVKQESGFNVAAQNLTAKEQSYGVMQLNTMGGLGVDALKAGINVRDPSTWKQQVDFGLDVVKRDGWRQWYGARDVGISRWEGVGGAGSNTASQASAPAIQGLDASLKGVESTAVTASQGVTSLTSDLGSLPNVLSQTSQGVAQLGSSLGSNGGGLGGILASLFGGGSGAATGTAVAAAEGGHIRGAGTSTSDSIAAWLSNGEFVVNAAATSRNLPLLHAINDNRMPAFAEGGAVGAIPATARRDEVARQQAAAGSAEDGAAGGVELHMHDNVGVKTTAKQSRNERGKPRMDVVLDAAIADVLARPGSQSGKALQTGWGLNRSLARRA